MLDSRERSQLAIRTSGDVSIRPVDPLVTALEDPG